jgi:hypothetical protein
MTLVAGDIDLCVCTVLGAERESAAPRSRWQFASSSLKRHAQRSFLAMRNINQVQLLLTAWLRAARRNKRAADSLRATNSSVLRGKEEQDTVRSDLVDVRAQMDIYSSRHMQCSQLP